MDSRNTLLQVWGKARHKDRLGGAPFHPAILHMLDVAAVALVMLEEFVPSALVTLLLGPRRDGPALTTRQAALIVAGHDLGKISPGFQLKVPELTKGLREAGLRFPTNAETDHGFVTSCTLSSCLLGLGAGDRGAKLAARAVGAHHGRLHGDGAGQAQERSQGDEAWVHLRHVAFKALTGALHVEEMAALQDVSLEWLTIFAGFTSVADWIGSSSYFEYRMDEDPSDHYLQNSLDTARRTLAQLGWRAWRQPVESPNFADLFPGLQARGIQRTVARELGDLGRATLLLIEAPTGCGKTEAALHAAVAMARQGGLGGIYYALPTQATSNQMFGRVRRFLEVVAKDGQTQFHLLHSAADLQPEYRDLFAPEVEPNGVYDVDVESREPRSVVADEWYRAKKRGLLSPFAVGTIDQALLATLEARHFFVRLFGLAGKVLIVDEVHAYDTYMSRIHVELLRWLSTTGASVILLSATLPVDRREALLNAWTGRNESSTRVEYPRLAIARPGEQPRVLAGEPVESRTVRLQTVPDDVNALAQDLADRLRGGGSAAWICNTVGRAQTAYQSLRAHFKPGEELLAVHARYPMEERTKREQRLQDLFGPAAHRPRRFVVVATQVIEQSLDIDFDLMVTDLAPIDLMIQRAGRLHRHVDRIPPASRPPGMRDPTLLWASKKVASTFEQLEREALPYHPHVLLRTHLALEGRASLVLPADGDALLDLVYGRGGEIPMAMRSLWEASFADLQRTRDDAEKRASLPLFTYCEDARKAIRNGTNSLDEDDPFIHPSLRAKTRDIEATATVVCLFDQGVQLSLDPEGHSPAPLDCVPDRDLQRRLLRQAISISSPGWVKTMAKLEVPDAWKRVAQMRHVRVLRLNRSGAWLENAEVRLDAELGLVLPGRSARGDR